MNVKINSKKIEKKLSFDDLEVGKLYNYYDKDDETLKGIVLVMEEIDDYTKIRLCEISGEDICKIWAQNLDFDFYDFTEFDGEITISN